MMLNSFSGLMPAMQPSSIRPAVNQSGPQSASTNSMPPSSSSANTAMPSIPAMMLPAFGNWLGNTSQQIGSGLQTWGNSVSNGLNTLGQITGSFGTTASSWVSGILPTRMNALAPTQQSQPPQAVSGTEGLRKTGQQIFHSMSNGANQALQDLGNLMTTQTPGMLAFGGGMMGAGGVCAYMCGGMAASGAAMLLNQNHGHSV